MRPEQWQGQVRRDGNRKTGHHQKRTIWINDRTYFIDKIRVIYFSFVTLVFITFFLFIKDLSS